MKSTTKYFWSYRDWLVGLVVGLGSFCLYVYTLAPNVTLEDSGEFITAAAHFGVPHPSGYPIWTLCSWMLTKVLPFGNVAWKVNLFSAICGALAAAFMSMLASHSTRWLLASLLPRKEEVQSRIAFWAALTASSVLVFSDVMWSQAVIAEVYTLNALFLSLMLLFFYHWLRVPDQTRWLLASVGSFSLGLTNHHTLLFFAPAYLVGVAMIRPRMLPNFMLATGWWGISVLVVLASFSSDGDIESISKKVVQLSALGTLGIAILWTKKINLRLFLRGGLITAILLLTLGAWMEGMCRIESLNAIPWIAGAFVVGGCIAQSTLSGRFILRLLVITWLGLSLYGYLRIASATTPPMNWGVASQREGFYHTITRGQYQDNLSSLIRDKFGFLIGKKGAAPDVEKKYEQRVDYFRNLGLGVLMYYRNLEDNFSLPICLLPLALLIGWGRSKGKWRRWFSFLAVTYFLLAVLITIISPPSSIDLQAQWIGKVFYLQSHVVFSLGIAYGIAVGLIYLYENWDERVLTCVPAVAVVAFIPLTHNVLECNQRNHWFGWMYATDTLRDLEKGAVVFGGTDPGRFVPTYSIFCESQDDPRWKREPSFDRSDLFIITQNALADKNYIKYIRDHYDEEHRRKTWNRFEQWLGRDHQYPKTSIQIPTDYEFEQSFIQFGKESGKVTKGGIIAPEGLDDVFHINSLVSRQIFEKNKSKCAFYFEESFPMMWMYDYAEPAGLLMKLNPEPLKEISKAKVDKDFEFWNDYIIKLETTPGFFDDIPARRSFAKLRVTMAAVYSYRKMDVEAEKAFQEALRLSPDSAEVVGRYADFCAKRNRIKEAKEIVKAGLKRDPENNNLKQMIVSFDQFIGLEHEEKMLKASLEKDPDNIELQAKMAKNLIDQGRQAEADEWIIKQTTDPGLNPQDVRAIGEQLLISRRYYALDKAFTIRSQMEPQNADWQYLLACSAITQGKHAQAMQYLKNSIRLQPESVRRLLTTDPIWRPYEALSEFQTLLRTNSVPKISSESKRVEAKKKPQTSGK